jgi:hypothetical protein
MITCCVGNVAVSGTNPTQLVINPDEERRE